MQKEHCSEEKKTRQLLSLGKKESHYLRLRRTRLGVQDFQTVKVIGKGAFGLVSIYTMMSPSWQRKNHVFNGEFDHD